MEKYAFELDLFASKYCLQMIENAVAAFVRKNYDQLEISPRFLDEIESASLDGMLLERTQNVQTYDKTISFDAIVSVDIELCGRGRRSYDDSSELVSQWFRVPCQVLFEENVINQRINTFKDGVEVFSSSARAKTPLAATSSLVPIIHNENYDKEATRFLEKYCPEALTTAMPLPIDKIIETLGLPPINYDNHLSPDFSVFGKICFSNEEFIAYDEQGVPHNISAKRGQIFIDINTYMACNIGCLNNTIAHELFHWVRHRLCMTIKRFFSTQNYQSTSCRIRPQGAHKRKDEPLDDFEWLELQANAISPRILMPIETAKPKADEILNKHGYNPLTNDWDVSLRGAIAEIADFFQVSKQLAMIRLSQFGYAQAQELFDADYESNIICTSQMPYTDIFKEYKENPDFRKTLDSGLFRYAEGRFIINDPKYLTKYDGGIYILTDYAREHLDECALQFKSIEIKGDFRGDGLYRKNKSNYVTIKKYINNPALFETAEELATLNEAHKKEAEYQRKLLVAVRSGTNFVESFNALIKIIFDIMGIQEHKRGATFADYTGLSDTIFRNMRNAEPTYCPEHKRIIAICAGFNLDVVIAENLLLAGNKSLGVSDEHQAYRQVLSVFKGHSMSEKSDYLEALGYGRLSDY